MEPEINNIQVNNHFDPLPEPNDSEHRANGGFTGAKNRYCSKENPTPVTKMPDFTIGDEDYSFNGIDETVNEGKFAPPETKKSHTGLTIFITVIIVFMILLGGFFAFYVATNGNNTKTGAEQYSYEETTAANYNYSADIYGDFDSYFEGISKSGKTEETVSEKDISENINKNWKGITLEKTPSSKTAHSAQIAYDKVSDSTVAVLCFADKITDAENADGQGTGMVISSDGYIVTNSHVVGDSRSAYKIQVVDQNSKKYRAVVVGYDTRTDIAVIKIDAKNLKTVKFGKSEDLSIGDDIIAVGNPGGIEFQNSLTKGIVSAKNRRIDNSTVRYIQTDAAVNPGNSGGPLCNLYGQVVGITTAKINSTLYEGMGFAIPSETIKEISDDIIKFGYVSNRVKIGITGVAINSYLSEAYGVPQGIVITDIGEDGSLANTKVEPKDIITKVDGESVSSFNDVYSILANHKPNDKISITLYRVNGSKGETYTITITLVEDKVKTQE
jgi:serine protease Do